MAKTAKRYAVTFELTCPHCGATIFSPLGEATNSAFWTRQEMDAVKTRTVPCEECQQPVRIPKGNV